MIHFRLCIVYNLLGVYIYECMYVCQFILCKNWKLILNSDSDTDQIKISVCTSISVLLINFHFSLTHSFVFCIYFSDIERMHYAGPTGKLLLMFYLAINHWINTRIKIKFSFSKIATNSIRPFIWLTFVWCICERI